jgi:hypothetical protein
MDPEEIAEDEAFHHAGMLVNRKVSGYSCHNSRPSS